MLQALRQQGLAYSEIARRTGYERRSFRNWLTSSAPRDRTRAALSPTSPLYFEAFLADCWIDGNRLCRHLFHDLRTRGYTGSRSSLERFLQVWRQAENVRPEVPPHEVKVPDSVRDPDTGHVISADADAALCIKPRSLLTNRQARKVDALKQGSEAFRKMRTLEMRFSGILRSRNPEAPTPFFNIAPIAATLHRLKSSRCKRDARRFVNKTGKRVRAAGHMIPAALDLLRVLPLRS